MKVTVSVTADDLANGKPGDACKCPVAKAINRAVPRGRGAVVNPSCCWFGPARRFKRDLPPVAHDFILAFDRGEEVEPFSFDLEV